ncbi:hypothetical protein GC163_16685 [bacterium]|nr:hypothetical protein [bacterium]
MSRPLLITIAVIVTMAGAWADEPTPSSAVATAISQAIRHLESLDASERSRGLKSLQDLGASALSDLPEDLSGYSPATRDILARLRNQWERELAAASLKPSMWELTRSETSSTFNIEMGIQSQTANVVRFDKQVSSSGVPQLEGNFTFWQGVSLLESVTETRCVWQPDRHHFLFTPVPPTLHPPKVIEGAARISQVSASLKPLPNNDRSQLLRSEWRLQIEPRLRPLFVRVAMKDWSGTTATNESLTPWNPPAVLELPFPDGGSEVVFPVDLLWPDAKATLWSLTGTATVHYTARWDTVAFAAHDLSPGIVKRRGGVAVRLRKVDFQPSGENQLRASIRIVVNYDQGGPAFESHRAGLFHRSARLIGRNETIYPAESFDVAAEADGAMILEYLFDKLPGQPLDYRFEYAAPTQLLDVAYPIRFRDLPAPTPVAD